MDQGGATQPIPTGTALRGKLTPSAMQEVLAVSGLFAGLPRADIEALSGLARERRVKRDGLVVQRGSPGSSLLVLVHGMLRAGSMSEEGRELTLGLMTPGSVLGEIALMDGGPRSADVVAMKDSVLLELERAAFMPFLLARPALMVRLIEILCARLRRTSAAYVDVALLSLPQRLARLLLTLAEEHGRSLPEGGGVRITLRLSQRELSAQVAATRERVNKQLRQWHEQGVLADHDGNLVVRNAAALRAVVAG